MAGEHGTKNAALILNLLAEGGNVAEKMIKQEGSFFQKIANLSMLFDEVMALFGLNLQELGKELGELDDADIAELKEAFKAKFDLSDEQMEGIIEDGLALAVKLGGDAKDIIAWVQKFKK